jgi:hypothetical protein
MALMGQRVSDIAVIRAQRRSRLPAGAGQVMRVRVMVVLMEAREKWGNIGVTANAKGLRGVLRVQILRRSTGKPV